MQRALAISLLFIYLTVLCKPLMPYLDYAINKDYIAEFLCINKSKPITRCEGKCHLTKNLIEASKKEKNNSEPYSPTRTVKEEPQIFNNSKMEYFRLPENMKIKIPGFITALYSQTYLEIPTPPPKHKMLTTSNNIG